MDKNHRDIKAIIFAIVVIFLLLIISMQNCKRSQQIDTGFINSNKLIDSVQSINEINNLNTNINYLKELQKLTNAIVLKDKQTLIESQSQQIELLNERLKNLKNKLNNDSTKK